MPALIHKVLAEPGDIFQQKTNCAGEGLSMAIFILVRTAVDKINGDCSDICAALNHSLTPSL